MENNENVSTKNRFTTLMLCWFLGFLGVHRLYAGKIGSGFLMAYGTLVTILLIIALVLAGLTPFVVVNEIKKASLKDKNYKLFRIKLKQEELQQKLARLEKEIKEYEESFIDNQETEK